MAKDKYPSTDIFAPNGGYCLYYPQIFRAWYNGSYTMIAKPMKTFELHYPMIQFLIVSDITQF